MEHHKVCVSVVVPIYNTAAYLTECLSSIASQSFPDFEVWMIDDGSTDQSGEIAQAFAEQDSRFHLIHQENRGLSGARNAGILMCSRRISFLCGQRRPCGFQLSFEIVRDR